MIAIDLDLAYYGLTYNWSKDDFDTVKTIWVDKLDNSERRSLLKTFIRSGDDSLRDLGDFLMLLSLPDGSPVHN